MKKICIKTLCLLLAFSLLAGCAPKESVTTTVATTGKQSQTASSTAEVTTTVTSASASSTSAQKANDHADRIWFSNDLEYYRLYSILPDGTGLRLELDEITREVKYHGGYIYYTDYSDVYRFDPKTGENVIFAEGASDFEIAGDHMAWNSYNGQYYVSALYLCDLETGDVKYIDTLNMGYYTLGKGYLYYSTYLDDGSQPIMVYDIEKAESRVLNDDFGFSYGFRAAEDGLFFVGNEKEKSGYYHVSAPEGIPVKQDYIPDNGLTVYAVTKDGVICEESHYADGHSNAEMFLLKKDGTRKNIISGIGGFSLHDAGEGHILIKETDYEPWGEMHPQGYYENYCSPVKYYLLDENMNISEFEVTGEAGSLFSGGDFPLIDSSTARKPVTAALYNLFVKNYGYEGSAPICATTHGAWLNIADRVTDLALLAAPTEEEQAYLKSKGVEIEMKLYGGDGLVFIGNAANPVTDLTHEQIIAIYRGEITNWKEVGGPDHAITVYFRDDQSGSQRLFESLVFKGLEKPDYYGLGFSIMDDMSSIVNIILEDPYAIGYSIMTYLDEVYSNEELQVFGVGGVLPSPETVADSSYRYNTKGYIVIRADEPEDSPARRLFDWFGCPMSDDLLKNNSVSPLSE